MWRMRYILGAAQLRRSLKPTMASSWNLCMYGATAGGVSGAVRRQGATVRVPELTPTAR
jgi:hypothetical protein